MSDLNSASVRLLLETVASQAQTIRAQAETIRHLLGQPPADEMDEAGQSSYMDGTPVR